MLIVKFPVIVVVVYVATSLVNKGEYIAATAAASGCDCATDVQTPLAR